MTNEGIVARIQAGEKNLMEELWNNMKHMTAWYAHRIMARCSENGYHGMEFEDLCQSGFLALAAAVPSYDPAAGSFTNWFVLHLKTAFADATGYRTERQRQDPIYNHQSLDAPLQNKDGESDTTMGDLIPGQASEDDPYQDARIAAAEETIFQEQLRAAVAAAVAELPEQQRDVLALRYWDGLSCRDAAERKNTDASIISNIERKAICTLRKPQHAKYLRPYVEFNSYSGTGYSSWSHTGSSVEERYVIRKEKLEAEGRGLTAV